MPREVATAIPGKPLSHGQDLKSQGISGIDNRRASAADLTSATPISSGVRSAGGCLAGPHVHLG
jgi:hypothetical protein